MTEITAQTLVRIPLRLLRYVMAFVLMPLISCSLPTRVADEVARGADRITARINGIPYTFEITQATNYFGIHVSGKSDRTSLGFNLSSGIPGTYRWSGPASYDMSGAAWASLNGLYAIRDLGFLKVDKSSSAEEFIAGTFAFVVVDQTSRDTIAVTDGTFRIHYTSTD